MKEKLGDVRFIDLPKDRKIGDFVFRSGVPLPVVVSEGQVAGDIDIHSIAAGLIKVLAWDEKSRHKKYYKEMLLSLQPDAVKELNLAAIAKSKKGEYDFAMELMLAVKNLSDAPESYVNLAVLYAQMTVDCHKRNEDSLADMYDDKILDILNECIERHPSFAPAYSEKSAFYMRHGNIQDAGAALEKFVELAPEGKEKSDATKTLANLDDMLINDSQIMYAYDKMMMGCADEAVSVIDTYLSKGKPCWEAYFIRGWAKRTLEMFDASQEDLLKSLSLDSSNAEVYNELSLCAKERGDGELAKSYLQIACDIDEDSAVYLTNLAFLHLMDKEYDKAKEILEKARAVDENDPELKVLMEKYETETGEQFSEVIKEEVFTQEQFDELHKAEHENHHHEEL